MELQSVRQDGATDTSTFTWPSLFTAPQPYRTRTHSPPDSCSTQAATQQPAELREASLSPGNSVAGGGGRGNPSLADGCVESLKAQARAPALGGEVRVSPVLMRGRLGLGRTWPMAIIFAQKDL